MTKAELRKIYIGRQKNLSADERKQKNEQIAGNFFQSFDLSEIKFLHCFLAIEKFGEVNTSLVFKRLWHKFPNVATFVPRIDYKTNEIKSLRFAPETELVRNRWQIDEPAHDETIEPEKIDACLVPLLCFDRRGFRVGYGKGFYDKFLKNRRADCLKIGLGYFAPVAEISDARQFDVKIDYCITPEKIWKFSI